MATLRTIKPGLSTPQSSLAPQKANTAAYAEHRYALRPWSAWYNTARWKALRKQILLRDVFTCQWPGCGQAHHDTSKLVAHHRQPHRGDVALFWSDDNLTCVCKACHDGPIQAQEQRQSQGGGGVKL